MLGAALNRCLESVTITPHAHAPQVCVAMLHGMNGLVIGPHRKRRRMSASRYVPISSWDNPRHRVGSATLRIGTRRSIQNDPDRFTCDRFHGRLQFRRHDLAGVTKVERILEQFQNNSSYGQVTKTLPGATPLQRHHRFQATEKSDLSWHRPKSCFPLGPDGRCRLPVLGIMHIRRIVRMVQIHQKRVGFVAIFGIASESGRHYTGFGAVFMLRTCV